MALEHAAVNMKSDIVKMAEYMRTVRPSWVPLTTLMELFGSDIRMAVDVLQYAGVLRSRYTTVDMAFEDLEYQWVRS